MAHRLGITMGDPSGVGPEVTVRALDALPAGERARAVVIGDRGTLERAARVSGLGTARDRRHRRRDPRVRHDS